MYIIYMCVCIIYIHDEQPSEIYNIYFIRVHKARSGGGSGCSWCGGGGGGRSWWLTTTTRVSRIGKDECNARAAERRRRTRAPDEVDCDDDVD